MNIPTPENQNFSERTLKGFLLKNVDPNTTDPHILSLNDFLIKRVNTFWEEVVMPMRNSGKFNGNKINWYFEVYKEGLEARKMSQNPFTFVDINDDTVREIVKYFDGKSLQEYLASGMSFLASAYAVLSSWHRDQLVMRRLEYIYNSGEPIDWVLRAEEEERGKMAEKLDRVPGVTDVITNIGLLMSRRV